MKVLRSSLKQGGMIGLIACSTAKDVLKLYAELYPQAGHVWGSEHHVGVLVGGIRLDPKGYFRVNFSTEAVDFAENRGTATIPVDGIFTLRNSMLEGESSARKEAAKKMLEKAFGGDSMANLLLERLVRLSNNSGLTEVLLKVIPEVKAEKAKKAEFMKKLPKQDVTQQTSYMRHNPFTLPLSEYRTGRFVFADAAASRLPLNAAQIDATQRLLENHFDGFMVIGKNGAMQTHITAAAQLDDYRASALLREIKARGLVRAGPINKILQEAFPQLNFPQIYALHYNGWIIFDSEFLKTATSEQITAKLIHEAGAILGKTHEENLKAENDFYTKTSEVMLPVVEMPQGYSFPENRAVITDKPGILAYEDILTLFGKALLSENNSHLEKTFAELQKMGISMWDIANVRAAIAMAARTGVVANLNNPEFSAFTEQAVREFYDSRNSVEVVTGLSELFDALKDDSMAYTRLFSREFKGIIAFAKEKFSVSEVHPSVLMAVLAASRELNRSKVEELTARLEANGERLYSAQFITLVYLAHHAEEQELLFNREKLLSAASKIYQKKAYPRLDHRYSERPELSEISNLKLYLLIKLNNSLHDSRVLAEIGRNIWDDINVYKNTELGGSWIFRNGILWPKTMTSLSDDNGGYVNDIKSYAISAGLDWHQHAMAEDESSYPGPSADATGREGDIGEARKSRNVNIVITAMGHPKDTLGNDIKAQIIVNVDMYWVEPDGTVKIIDLGVFAVPYEATKPETDKNATLVTDDVDAKELLTTDTKKETEERYEKAKEESSVNGKIKALREIIKSRGISTATLGESLDDLWRLEYLTGDVAALETYKQYLQSKGMTEDKHGTEEINTYMYLYSDQGRYKELLQYLTRQLKIKEQSGEQELLGLLQSKLKDVYLILGDYESFLAVPHEQHLDSTVRRLKLIMDKQKMPYQPSFGCLLGDLRHYASRKEVPLRIFVKPDLAQQLHKDFGASILQDPLYLALKSHDSQYIGRLIRDANRVLSYISGGQFSFKVERIEFRYPSQLEDVEEGGNPTMDNYLEIKASPENRSFLGKGFIAMIGFPFDTKEAGGIKSTIYTGDGLFFVYPGRMSNNNGRSQITPAESLITLIIHEALHGLGMRHRQIYQAQDEYYSYLIEKGHKFPATENDNLTLDASGFPENEVSDRSAYISQTNRILLGWPDVSPVLIRELLEKERDLAQPETTLRVAETSQTFDAIKSPKDIVELEVKAYKDAETLYAIINHLPALEKIIKESPELSTAGVELLFTLAFKPKLFKAKYDTALAVKSLERSVKTLQLLMRQGKMVEDLGSLPHSHLEHLAQRRYAFAVDALVDMYTKEPVYSTAWYAAGLALKILLQYSYQEQIVGQTRTIGEALLPVFIKDEVIRDEFAKILSQGNAEAVVKFIDKNPELSLFTIVNFRGKSDVLQKIKNTTELPLEVRFYALGLLLADLPGGEAQKLLLEENWFENAHRLLTSKELATKNTMGELLGNNPLAHEERMQLYWLAVVLNFYNYDEAFYGKSDTKKMTTILDIAKSAIGGRFSAYVKGFWSVFVVGVNELSLEPYIFLAILNHETYHKILYSQGFVKTLSNYNEAAMHEFLCDVAEFRFLQTTVSDQSAEYIDKLRSRYHYQDGLQKWEHRKNDEEISDSHIAARGSLERFITTYNKFSWAKFMEIATEVLLENKDILTGTPEPYGPFTKFVDELEQRARKEHLFNPRQQKAKDSKDTVTPGVEEKASLQLPGLKSIPVLFMTPSRNFSGMFADAAASDQPLNVGQRKALEAAGATVARNSGGSEAQAQKANTQEVARLIMSVKERERSRLYEELKSKGFIRAGPINEEAKKLDPTMPRIYATNHNGVIILDSDFVKTATPLQVAAKIVHELGALLGKSHNENIQAEAGFLGQHSQAFLSGNQSQYVQGDTPAYDTPLKVLIGTGKFVNSDGKPLDRFLESLGFNTKALPYIRNLEPSDLDILEKYMAEHSGRQKFILTWLAGQHTKNPELELQVKKILGVAQGSELLSMQPEDFKRLWQDPAIQQQLRALLSITQSEQVNDISDIEKRLYIFYNVTGNKLLAQNQDYLIAQAKMLGAWLKKVDPKGERIIVKIGNEINYYYRQGEARSEAYEHFVRLEPAALYNLLNTLAGQILAVDAGRKIGLSLGRLDKEESALRGNISNFTYIMNNRFPNWEQEFGGNRDSNKLLRPEQYYAGIIDDMRIVKRLGKEALIVEAGQSSRLFRSKDGSVVEGIGEEGQARFAWVLFNGLLPFIKDGTLKGFIWYTTFPQRWQISEGDTMDELYLSLFEEVAGKPGVYRVKPVVHELSKVYALWQLAAAGLPVEPAEVAPYEVKPEPAVKTGITLPEAPEEKLVPLKIGVTEEATDAELPYRYSREHPQETVVVITNNDNVIDHTVLAQALQMQTKTYIDKSAQAAEAKPFKISIIRGGREIAGMTPSDSWIVRELRREGRNDLPKHKVVVSWAFEKDSQGKEIRQIKDFFIFDEDGKGYARVSSFNNSWKAVWGDFPQDLPQAASRTRSGAYAKAITLYNAAISKEGDKYVLDLDYNSWLNIQSAPATWTLAISRLLSGEALDAARAYDIQAMLSWIFSSYRPYSTAVGNRYINSEKVHTNNWNRYLDYATGTLVQKVYLNAPAMAIIRINGNAGQVLFISTAETKYPLQGKLLGSFAISFHNGAVRFDLNGLRVEHPNFNSFISGIQSGNLYRNARQVGELGMRSEGKKVIYRGPAITVPSVNPARPVGQVREGDSIILITENDFDRKDISMTAIAPVGENVSPAQQRSWIENFVNTVIGLENDSLYSRLKFGEMPVGRIYRNMIVLAQPQQLVVEGRQVTVLPKHRVSIENGALTVGERIGYSRIVS
ncbi:MAG: hypothetical protein PHQ96_08055, partial [Candidatus Omnitrophica bacterium]|nr:hypothetical protein [Candidatus Omnitrophota bacterium]